MSTFTEADVQLVAQALDAEVWASDLAAARAVLAALADAGRLTPAGAVWRQQLGVRVDAEHPRRSEQAGHVMTHLSDETAQVAHKVWEGWTTVRRDVLEYASPWAELEAGTDG